jgi:uncharacterized protein (DUF433 family)
MPFAWSWGGVDDFQDSTYDGLALLGLSATWGSSSWRRSTTSSSRAEVTTQGILSDPDVMMGKPVVEGTRVTVESILDELGAGRTIEQLLAAHPRLTREGVLAAVRFGAEVLRADVAYPVSKSVT